jgi:hypothetical protein
MSLAARCPGDPVPRASSAGRSLPRFREYGLMAAYDEDHSTISRVLARPVTGAAKAGWSFTNRTGFVTLESGGGWCRSGTGRPRTELS